MAERQLPKLHTRVRFPSPAPTLSIRVPRNVPQFLGNGFTFSDRANRENRDGVAVLVPLEVGAAKAIRINVTIVPAGCPPLIRPQSHDPPRITKNELRPRADSPPDHPAVFPFWGVDLARDVVLMKPRPLSDFPAKISAVQKEQDSATYNSDVWQMRPEGRNQRAPREPAFCRGSNGKNARTMRFGGLGFLRYGM